MNTSVSADFQGAGQPLARWSVSGLTCVAAVTICVIYTAALLFGVPRFIEIFADFDAELPLLTNFVIQTRTPVAVLWSLVAIVLIAKEIALKHHKNITLPINLVFLAFACVWAVISLIVLLLPLSSLMQSVL